MIKKIKKMCQEMEEEYYRLIIKNRNKKKINELDELCKKYLNKTFKDVILVSPEKIKELVEKYGGLSKEKKNEFKKYYGYIINSLYKNMNIEARKIIFKNTDHNICPYCDRNYISFIKKDDEKYTSFFEIDHFWSKSDFFILAVSLYNLIPVCPACNRVKSNNEFKYYLYNNGNNDDVVFTYDIESCDFINNKESIYIKLKYNNMELKDDHKLLYIESLYQNHKDVIQEIIWKFIKYNKYYIKSLGELFGDRLSDDETYKFLFSNYYDVEDEGIRPLSKFTRDIVKETAGVYGIDIL